MVQLFSLASLSILLVNVGLEFIGKKASSQVVMALTPHFAQVIKASSTSASRLIVVTMVQSGFKLFSSSSDFAASSTTTPTLSPPMISPISFPITAGLLSTAPMIVPPFSIT